MIIIKAINIISLCALSIGVGFSVGQENINAATYVIGAIGLLNLGAATTL